MSVINIAIDGPAGAGKSSVAKAVSGRLGFLYVDTGSLYRAVALHMIKKGIAPGDEENVLPELSRLGADFFSLRFIDGAQHVFAGEDDVTGEIRTPEVSMGASQVSAIPGVRKYLFSLQQSIARGNNVIMDGRDIGTVVLPNADLKIFLTASPEERAERRFRELSGKPDCPSYEQVLEDIKQRDYSDTHRSVSPLKQADDAVLADTTGIDFEGSVGMVLELIRSRCKIQ